MPENPRRVLMTADAAGGVWTYALELARGLGECGIQVLLAVMGGGVTDRKRGEAAAVPGLRLEIHEGRLEWMQDPWDDVADAGDWLLELAGRFAPDMIHLNGYAHGALPWKAPVLMVAHSCVLSWFRAVRGEEAPPSWTRYRQVVRRGLRAADLVAAPSRAMLDEIFTSYGWLANTRVIPNGRDPHAFAPGDKQNLILAAGRVWDDAKNFRVLADAADALQWPVFLAGESTHPDGGTASMHSLHLLGSLDWEELNAWYARAAIYALPALYEPFGLSALEAALSGCALALSDIPSLREIWGDAACYVDPLDPAAWCFHLNALAQAEDRCRSLAGRARSRALELTASAMTRQYLEAYGQARQKRSCASASSATPFNPTGITETPISSVA